MSSRARKTSAPAAPVSAIAVDPLADGTQLHRFVVDGLAVAVESSTQALNPAAVELVARLHAICSIPPAPPRIEAWGPGQFDRVTLGPGVEAWIRITPEGRVRMVTPGGDLDVTDGSAALGTGLHEAGRGAAQIRVAREERRRKRERGAGGSGEGRRVVGRMRRSR